MIQSSCLPFLLLMFIVTTQAHAVYYKWVDADGKTHYSQTKPDGESKAELITPKSHPPTVERDGWQAQNQAFIERRKAAQKQAEKDTEAASDAAIIQRNCNLAERRVKSLSNPRINKVDADGKRTRMPEEWRQAQLVEAQTAAEKFCQ